VAICPPRCGNRKGVTGAALTKANLNGANPTGTTLRDPNHSSTILTGVVGNNCRATPLPT